MIKKFWILLFVAFISAGTFTTFTGCQQGPMEEAAEEVEDEIDDATDDQ